MTITEHLNPAVAPGLLRRLAAMAYDGFLLFALLMLGALPVIILNEGPPTSPVGRAAYQLYLLAIIYLFFTWFWVNGGQTLGMRAWRLQVVRQDGQALNWRQATRRFALAVLSWLACGLGFIWVWIDPDKLAWHDKLSGTRLVVLPKPKGRQ